MTISIHHGANGSYKTSGVIQDVFIPAALEGRVVVTNIRGISVEKTIEVLGDENVSSNFDVIYIDTTVSAGRDRVAKWFHWVPHNALLLFDECSVCFPKKWREKDLDLLAYESVEKAKEDNRPATWGEAWEMHRHFGWDIYIMNPSIKGVRDDIRNTTEAAYRHANGAVVGFKGRYKEGFHLAENNGVGAQILNTQAKKINKRTFLLYESTATGTVKDTAAAQSIFSSIPLLLALSISAAGFGYAILSGGLDFFFEADENLEAAQELLEEDPLAVIPANGQVGELYTGDLPVIEIDSPAVDHYFKDYEFRIIGSARYGINRRFILTLDREGFESIELLSTDLEDSGYTVYPINNCSFKLIFDDFETMVHCAPRIGVPIEQRGIGLRDRA